LSVVDLVLQDHISVFGFEFWLDGHLIKGELLICVIFLDSIDGLVDKVFIELELCRLNWLRLLIVFSLFFEFDLSDAG
jgi:hypothetical protein